jgi:hypothetical protein
MYINLDEGHVANAAEAMDLAGLDDKNVTSTGFEFLPVDGPEAPAFPDELDVAVLGSHEVVGAALKWQVLLTDALHPAWAPYPRVSAVGP